MHGRVNHQVNSCKDVLTPIEKKKLKWDGSVTRLQRLTKTILNGGRWIDISCTDCMTNEDTWRGMSHQLNGYKDELTTIKKKKLKWYAHINRLWGFFKTILQGIVQGWRRRDPKERDSQTMSSNGLVEVLSKLRLMVGSGVHFLLSEPPCNVSMTLASYGSRKRSDVHSRTRSTLAYATTNILCVFMTEIRSALLVV